MAKEELLVFDGDVLENLSNNRFCVKLQNEHEVICYICGKMSKKNRIQVIVGDKVKIEVSPYDLNKGRIVYRYTSKQVSS